MQSNGFNEQWLKKYFPKSDKCRADVKPKTIVEALKLSELSVMFVMLGLGLALSIAAFVAELIGFWCCWKESK